MTEKFGSSSIHAYSNSVSDSTLKARASSFFGWLFGTESPAIEPPSLLDSTNHAEFTVDLPSDKNSWVDSFNIALTEATASFILRHVAPLHREDSSIGFSVKKVKVGMRDAAAQCVRAIEAMPISMRNRIVQLRMKKAHGAEQLIFDNFYGLSITAEETLIDGQLIQTMISYSGSRFNLKFEFEGEYASLPMTEKSDPVLPSPTENLAPPPSVPVRNTEEINANKEPSMTPQSNVFIETNVPRPIVPSRETLLRISPRKATYSGVIGARETPLNIPVTPHRPVAAKLRLRSLGAETVVDLFEDNFPYVIGRHSSFSGYCVQGKQEAAKEPHHLLSDVEKPDYSSYVSRNHLILDTYDSVSRQFNVSTTKGKNGTFLNGATMPKLFIFPAVSDDWLSLGGESGSGVLEIRFEHA